MPRSCGKSSRDKSRRKLSSAKHKRNSRKMPRSKSRTSYPHPNLRKFVKKNILPVELSRISKIVTLYSNLLLKEIQRGVDSEMESWSLNNIIYNISPFPGWIDSGASNVWNGATSQLEEFDLVKDLKLALEKDGIRIQ
jgi:hypothetical protein